jgi:mRNA-degrading endonuclease toxin of MazEF toxin-antitoxin module
VDVVSGKGGDARQGQVWLVALDPAQGSETRKTRLVRKLVEMPETVTDKVADVLVEMFRRG